MQHKRLSPHKPVYMADGGIFDGAAASLRGWITGANNPTRQAGMAAAGDMPPQAMQPPAPVAQQPMSLRASPGVMNPELVSPTNPAGIRFADGGGLFSGMQDRLRGLITGSNNAQRREILAPPPVAPPEPVAAQPPPQRVIDPSLVSPSNPAGIRFADGGSLRDSRYYNGSMDGGKVVGKGHGTSDSVPAKYSTGEYVLPKDTVDAIGVEHLDAIKDATHVPAELQKRGLRMADGGYDDRLYKGTRAVLSGAGDDIAGAIRSGNYGSAIGHTLRSAAALPVAFADDTVGPLVRGAGAALPAVYQAGKTALTGQDTPASAVPSLSTALPAQPNNVGPGAPGSALSLAGDATGPGSERSAPLANDITRTGNSYSGNNISGEPTINGQQPGGGFISLPPPNGLRDSGPAAPTQPYTGPSGFNVGAFGFSRTPEQQRQDAATQATSIVKGTRDNGRTALKQFAEADIAAGHDAAQIGAAGLNANASLRGHQIGAAAQVQAAALRGRGDNTAALQKASDREEAAAIFKAAGGDRTKAAALARSRGRDDLATSYESSANADRTYEEGRSSKADGDLMKQLEATSVGADGKVDSAAVAQKMQGLNSALAALIQKSEAQGDTATADQLRKQGLAGIGKDRVQQLLAAQEVQGIAQRGNSNWNPFGATYVDSANPADYQIIGKKTGLFQDRYVAANGTQTPVNDIDKRDGVRTTRYDQIKARNLREIN